MNMKKLICTECHEELDFIYVTSGHIILNARGELEFETEGTDDCPEEACPKCHAFVLSDECVIEVKE